MKASTPVWCMYVAVTILFLTHTPAKSDIVLFDADMQGATVATDTDAANLNTGTATGTWTDSAGRSPSDINIATDGAAAQAVLADKDSGTVAPWQAFDLRADFASSAGFQDVVEVELDAYIRRSHNATLPYDKKDIHIVGLDGSGFESFHLQLSANDSVAGQRLRVGYVHSGGTVLVWDLPGAADADNDLVVTYSDTLAPSSLRGLKLRLSGNQYTISFDRDNDGVYDEVDENEWTTDWLDVNGSATAISQVWIYGETSDSGFFFDNVVARSFAFLILDFENATVGTNPPTGWMAIGSTYMTTNGVGNPGTCMHVDSGSTVYLVNAGEALDATKNISGSFDFYVEENGNYSNARFFIGDVQDGLTGTALGECLQVDLREKSFGVRANILGGDGTTLFDGSGNNAYEIATATWYSGSFTWTPTNGKTGNFSFSWGGTEGPMTVTGYTFDSREIFFGFGTTDDPARFDNIQITGQTIIIPAGTIFKFL